MTNTEFIEPKLVDEHWLLDSAIKHLKCVNAGLEEVSMSKKFESRKTELLILKAELEYHITYLEEINKIPSSDSSNSK